MTAASIAAARQRRAATYWRMTVQENPDLTALRDGFLGFAQGCTPEEADKVLAAIIAGWGMRPDQLPTIVGMLAQVSELGPNACLVWLYSTVRLMARPGAGRRLCAQLKNAVDRFDAFDAADPPPKRSERTH